MSLVSEKHDLKEISFHFSLQAGAHHRDDLLDVLPELRELRDEEEDLLLLLDPLLALELRPLAGRRGGEAAFFTGERERPRRGGVRERARRGGVLSLRLGGERPPRTGDLTEREGGRGERTRRAGGLERREGLATRRGGGLPPRRAWGLARRV
mmetsp:Transcript_14961/g.40362  ORF Transcript_14961/g.40362 Transcript_14961/m.40362 type:complete len:153 (-) Transcript_14961:834-1292(-)